MAEVVRVRRCPICHKIASDEKYRPFCSKRCADIDLGHWLDGSYSVVAQDLDEKDYEELEQALLTEDKEDK